MEHSVRDLRTKSGNGVEEVPAKLLMLPRQSDTLLVTTVAESFYPNQYCVNNAVLYKAPVDRLEKSLLKFASEEKSEETL